MVGNVGDILGSMGGVGLFRPTRRRGPHTPVTPLPGIMNDMQGFAQRTPSLFRQAQGQFSNPYRGTPQGLAVRDVKRDYIQGLAANDRRQRNRVMLPQMGPWNTSSDYSSFLEGYEPGTGGIWGPNPRWGGR